MLNKQHRNAKLFWIFKLLFIFSFFLLLLTFTAIEWRGKKINKKCERDSLFKSDKRNKRNRKKYFKWKIYNIVLMLLRFLHSLSRYMILCYYFHFIRNGMEKNSGKLRMRKAHIKVLFDSFFCYLRMNKFFKVGFSVLQFCKFISYGLIATFWLTVPFYIICKKMWF